MTAKVNKTIIIILFILTATFIGFTLFGQESRIDSSFMLKQDNNEQLLSGSCASPDGPMFPTVIIPPNYAWLLANGYCYAIGPQKIFTMCFTFTPTSPNVSLNAGYSSTGCATINFSGFNLYTCNPACVFVGSGLSFTTLTSGQCYTWCLTGTCTGPGPGFDHVCPYYMNNVILPIQMLEFGCQMDGTTINLNWLTATEQNNWYFEVLRSIDGIHFMELDRVDGNGSTSQTSSYQFVDNQPFSGDNYYKLKQVDYNGSFVEFGPIICQYYELESISIDYFNLLGQLVSDPVSGIFIKRITRKSGVEFKKVLL